MPVNPYDDRKVSLRRPHGNGDLDIVRASYTRRNANVTVYNRLVPRVNKIKNGYPKSSKVCYSINLKKHIRCIRNHCIANFSELHNTTRANKVW